MNFHSLACTTTISLAWTPPWCYQSQLWLVHWLFFISPLNHTKPFLSWLPLASYLLFREGSISRSVMSGKKHSTGNQETFLLFLLFWLISIIMLERNFLEYLQHQRSNTQGFLILYPGCNGALCQNVWTVPALKLGSLPNNGFIQNRKLSFNSSVYCAFQPFLRVPHNLIIRVVCRMLQWLLVKSLRMTI
jgi:hypothetical protein